jgi:O-antigen/teichoic acid export membrane protein
LTTRALGLAFAKTLAFVFNFALPLLLVRRLSIKDFGLYKQVFLVVNTAVIVLPFSIGMSAFYFLPRERERQGNVVFNVVLFSAMMGGLACLALTIYPGLLELIFGGRDLVPYAPQISLVILLWIVALFIDVAPIANQETRIATTMIIATQLSRALVLLGAALFFGTVRALIYGAIIHGAAQVCVLLFYLHTRWNGFWRKFDASLFRTQLAYALPFGFAWLLYWFQLDLHNYFVSHHFGAEAFAIYSVGCFQLPLIWMLADAASSVMFTRVSSMQKDGDHQGVLMLTMQAMRKLAVAFFPVYAFLLVMGREFIVFFFSERYAASWPIFAVNITLIPLGILQLDPIMRAYAENRSFLLKLNAVLLVAMLLAFLLGTKMLGLVGIISLVVVFHVAGRLAMAWQSARVIGVKRGDWRLLKDVGKIALATVAAAAATAALRPAMQGMKPLAALAVGGVVFGLVYLAAVLALAVVTPQERAMLTDKLGALQRRVPWRRAVEPLP